MIVAAIPARSGSKGISDKNIVDLGGKPLLAWTIETAKQVPEISRIILSTDSSEYGEIAVKHGIEEWVLRPPEISQDASTDYEWVEHLLSLYKSQHWDLIVHLRPTTPLRYPQLIRNAIVSLIYHDEATSLRSVHEMAETAYKAVRVFGGLMYPICEEKTKDFNQPRQNYPKTYHPNGYVDIYRVKHTLEHKELLGDKILAFETSRVIEVDTPEDLEYLRWLVSNIPTPKCKTEKRFL